MDTKISVKNATTDTWVVITSINSFKTRYLSYLDLGWKVLIVADLKTPVQSYRNQKVGVELLTLERQTEEFPELCKIIPLNTYARKNLGYLYALKNGAKRIWDTDDDTFIRPEYMKEDFLSNFDSINTVEGYGVLNPYDYFASGSGLWPRGYPLRRLKSNERSANAKIMQAEVLNLETVDIIQTLVNLSPDVDAIYRLTVGSHTHEYGISRELLSINFPMVVPGNTQSTLLNSLNSFYWAYIPTSVSFRFCDILRTYLLQANCKIMHAGFVSEQFRNQHDLMEDFAQEVECYLNVELLLSVVEDLRGKSLLEAYARLKEHNLVTGYELEAASCYQESVEKYLK